MPIQMSLPFTEFDLPQFERQDVRRVPRMAAPAPVLVNRHDRIMKRNRVLVARYYYWTELKRRRFDDTIRLLSENEFFVDERTVTNAIMENNDFFKSLCDSKTGSRKLRMMFPGFDWN